MLKYSVFEFFLMIDNMIFKVIIKKVVMLINYNNVFFFSVIVYTIYS